MFQLHHAGKALIAEIMNKLGDQPVDRVDPALEAGGARLLLGAEICAAKGEDD